MWQLFTGTIFNWWKIKFDQVWSILDRSDLFKNKITIFILMVNVTTFYSNIFWMVRNPVWSSLIKIWSKKIINKTAIFSWWTFCGNIFRLVKNPILSSLIHFGQIWSKKIQNKTVIFIFFVNVTTFYSKINFFVRWEIQFYQVWSSLVHFGQIWSKKIQNKTAIFILFCNVATFYCTGSAMAKWTK